MDSKCTIFFEDPFWVGVFERDDDGSFAAARYVFGSEPTDAELLLFAARQSHGLVFSACISAPEAGLSRVNFKRRQRMVRQETGHKGIGTFAQNALQAERERLKQVNSVKSRAERLTEKREKFLQKQTRKKEKHHGH